uniref:L-aspartate oxidase n=1 Tax=uncultured marine group II/III euryarchaeote KM3_88_E02 TaxID=1456536 RepID=A0A075HWT0_9EURY|nr:Aspartate oxidase (nadB) [uncultured marine group II/III euryarchaeote KM3_88_E02]
MALVTKKRLSDSSTNWAQGGIAGVLDSTDADALEGHVRDTLSAGGGICDEAIVRLVVNEASARIDDLIQEGVKFDQTDDGEYDLAMEGGHEQRRILHTKDATGAEIERALIEGCRSSPDVTIHEDCLALDLILADRHSEKRGVVGLWCLNENGTVFTLPSRAVLLATGGAGQLWRQTTNPTVATGDGIAMAVRAGAAVRDMEFVQFHPTALALKGERPFLITEAVRGVGAVLMTENEVKAWRTARNSDPKVRPELFSFMREADPRGSLATRDVVARAADAEMKRSGRSHVMLVTEHLDGEMLAEKFPTIAKRIGAHNLVFGRNPIPVAPAAHYLVGGLAVNEWGEVWQRDLTADDPTFSTRNGRAVAGLYAIGEAACTGLHGANRLASNSLLEAVVFSNRAGERVIEWLDGNGAEVGEDDTEAKFADGEKKLTLPDWRAEGLADLEEHAPLVHDRQQLRSTMSDDVGLVKSDWRLSRAERRLTLLDDEVDRIWQRCLPSNELVELRNMVLLGRLVIAASKSRKENVGLHYNIDN